MKIPFTPVVYPPADSFWNVLLKFEVKMRFANGIRWTYPICQPC